MAFHIQYGYQQCRISSPICLSSLECSRCSDFVRCHGHDSSLLSSAICEMASSFNRSGSANHHKKHCVSSNSFTPHSPSNAAKMSSGKGALKSSGMTNFPRSCPKLSLRWDGTLRDFQLKKYPKISCGAGISPANNTRTGKMPIPHPTRLDHLFCGVL